MRLGNWGTGDIPFQPARAARLPAYPDIGHASGSDTCNSSLADRPGRMTSLDPLREITPIPCAHPHAWSLYAYHLLREASAVTEGQPRA
jgi:hypothetical protein